MEHKYEVSFESVGTTENEKQALRNYLNGKYRSYAVTQLHEDPLPLKPALYTTAKADHDIDTFRVFRLTKVGRWVEYDDPNSRLGDEYEEDKRCRELFKSYGWTLTKLVLEK